MSELFKLDKKDFIRGLIVATLTGVLTAVLKVLENKGLMISWDDLQAVLSSALIAGIGYLIKNFITDSEQKLGGKIQL